MCWPVCLWALEANINSAWVLELCTILERKSRVDTHKASWAQNTLLSSIYRFWLSETFILSLQWSHEVENLRKKNVCDHVHQEKCCQRLEKFLFLIALHLRIQLLSKDLVSFKKHTHTDKQALYIWCSVFWGQADLKKAGVVWSEAGAGSSGSWAWFITSHRVEAGTAGKWVNTPTQPSHCAAPALRIKFKSLFKASTKAGWSSLCPGSALTKNEMSQVTKPLTASNILRTVLPAASEKGGRRDEIPNQPGEKTNRAI